MTSTPDQPALLVPGRTAAGDEPEAALGWDQWPDEDRDLDYDELGGES